MTNSIVEASWREFKAGVLPRDAPAVQSVEMRRAYYAGVWMLHCKLREIGGDSISEEEGVVILERIGKECQEFYEQLKRGLA